MCKKGTLQTYEGHVTTITFARILHKHFPCCALLKNIGFWLSLIFLVNSPASSRVQTYTVSSQLAQELTQGLLLVFSPAVWEVSYGQAGWRMLWKNTLFQTLVYNWQLRTKAGLGWSPWMLDLAKALSSKHRWGVR